MNRQRTFVFNGGKSQLRLLWSPVNSAWVVARWDGELSKVFRVLPDYAEASADYEDRREFIREMGAVR